MGKLRKTVKNIGKKITPSFLGGDAKSIYGHRAWEDVKRTGRKLDDSGVTAAAVGYAVGGPMGAAAAYSGKKQRDAMGELMDGDDEIPTEATIAMPEPDSEEIARARRRQTAEQLKRKGRSSTILTDSSSDQL
jgi:hypothetical protein